MSTNARRAVDRAIDMRFGRQIHHRPRACARRTPASMAAASAMSASTNVTPGSSRHRQGSGGCPHSVSLSTTTSRSQGVVEEVPNEVRSDESGTAADQDGRICELGLLASSKTECDLSAVKRLGVPTRRAALHPAKPHQAHEGLGRKPVLVALGAESRLEISRLTCAERFRQRHEAIRLAEVAVELGNLVLQNEVVAKRVPGEIREHPVILMTVVPVVREDEIRIGFLLQLLEDRLDVSAFVRKESISKLLGNDSRSTGAFEKQPGASSRFQLARAGGRKDDPIDVDGLTAARLRRG